MSPARAAKPATAQPASDEAAGHIRVTQVRSAIGSKPKHRSTLRALGLRGVGRSRVLPDRPDVRGMVARVPHLVEVAPAGAEDAAAERARRDAARHAHRVAEGRGDVVREASAP